MTIWGTHSSKNKKTVFGGTPSTSLRHPCVPLHPDWESLDYSKPLKLHWKRNVVEKCHVALLFNSGNWNLRSKTNYLLRRESELKKFLQTFLKQDWRTTLGIRLRLIQQQQQQQQQQQKCSVFVQALRFYVVLSKVMVGWIFKRFFKFFKCIHYHSLLSTALWNA